MFKEIEKCISAFSTPISYYICKLLKPAGFILTNNNKEVRQMSWKKTSIKITMGNKVYPNGVKTTTYNNIVPDPTKEQIKQFAQGLLLLSDGDTFLGSEVIKYDELGAE